MFRWKNGCKISTILFYGIIMMCPMMDMIGTQNPTSTTRCEHGYKTLPFGFASVLDIFADGYLLYHTLSNLLPFLDVTRISLWCSGGAWAKMEGWPCINLRQDYEEIISSWVTLLVENHIEQGAWPCWPTLSSKELEVGRPWEQFLNISILVWRGWIEAWGRYSGCGDASWAGIAWCRR